MTAASTGLFHSGPIAFFSNYYISLDLHYLILSNSFLCVGEFFISQLIHKTFWSRNYSLHPSLSLCVEGQACG